MVLVGLTGHKPLQQVPPRFELGSLDSESRVLTITPWNPHAALPHVWTDTFWPAITMWFKWPWRHATTEQANCHLLENFNMFLDGGHVAVALFKALRKAVDTVKHHSMLYK